MPVPEGMYGIPPVMPMSQPIMVQVGMAIATTAIMTTSAMATLRLLAPANIESLQNTDYEA
jgi:Na+-translocating ferredoxin:NAD+ oxidoreductase RnfA subunit